MDTLGPMEQSGPIVAEESTITAPMYCGPVAKFCGLDSASAVRWRACPGKRK